MRDAETTSSGNAPVPALPAAEDEALAGAAFEWAPGSVVPGLRRMRAAKVKRCFTLLPVLLEDAFVMSLRMAAIIPLKSKLGFAVAH